MRMMTHPVEIPKDKCCFLTCTSEVRGHVSWGQMMMIHWKVSLSGSPGYAAKPWV